MPGEIVECFVYVRVAGARPHLVGSVRVPQGTKYIALRDALFQDQNVLDVVGSCGLPHAGSWQLLPVCTDSEGNWVQRDHAPFHLLTVADFAMEGKDGDKPEFVVHMVAVRDAQRRPAAVAAAKPTLTQPTPPSRPGLEVPQPAPSTPRAQEERRGALVRVFPTWQGKRPLPTRNFTDGSPNALKQAYGGEIDRNTLYNKDFTHETMPLVVYFGTTFCVKTNFPASFDVSPPLCERVPTVSSNAFEGKLDKNCFEFVLVVRDAISDAVVMTFRVQPADDRTRRNHHKALGEQGMEGCDGVGKAWAKWFRSACGILSRQQFVAAMCDPDQRRCLQQRLRSIQGRNKPDLDKLWHFELDRIAWEKRVAAQQRALVAGRQNRAASAVSGVVAEAVRPISAAAAARPPPSPAKSELADFDLASGLKRRLVPLPTVSRKRSRDASGDTRHGRTQVPAC